MNKLYKNEYLFSEIYLEEITNFEEKPEVVSSLKTLKDYFEFSNKESLSEWKNSFIQKVFGVLGFGYKSVTDNLIQLFIQGKTDKPISLCFTLLPSDDLDNATIGRHWSEKIIRNLRNEKLNWGILTNGINWRIYHVNEPTPYENYIELDLQKILENEDSKNYMIFYEFMKADNFVLSEEKKCKFDEFKKDSYDKIEYIEEELKYALKQEQEDGKGVLADLCMGYVEFLKSKGKSDFKDDAFRKEIYSGAMLYMFRLLFVFYASARDLLTNEEIDSFYKLLKKSKNLFKSNKASRTSYELWHELREIFGIIDVHYNGGLFDPLENKFIENNRVSDYFLCRVLYNMNFYEDEDGNEKPISYRDMGVRHLGTLYEGLLEHKLFLAEEDTEVKFVKGEIKFIPESEGGVIVEGKYIPKGQVYFGTDKYERKSTGSYFTPEYIVDYIVTSTVGEKLKELKEKFDGETKELIEDIKIASDEKEKNVLIKELRNKTYEFTGKKILKLSVLDPAMGSGHFLVNAATQISNFITSYLNDPGYIFEDTSSPVYWRRRVVENCIYGVDINPLAVELAKLSLWILSMAKDVHLSFLNHHLKCGDSLVGTKVADLGKIPSEEKSKQLHLGDIIIDYERAIKEAIDSYGQIENIETKGDETIGRKQDLLNNANKGLSTYKKLLDYHTSVCLSKIDSFEYSTTIKNPDKIKSFNNNYFHWELEFPEIFGSLGGFECVIGNPPYVDANFNNYFYFFPQTYETKNLFCFFSELAINVSSSGAFHSFIVPLSGFAMPEMKSYQNLILNNSLELYIANFSWRPGKIFEQVNIPVSVFNLRKKTTSSDKLTNLFTTHYLRWYKYEDGAPLNKIKFIECKKYLSVSPGFLPKVGNEIEISILDKVLKHTKLEKFITKKVHSESEKLYYRSKGGLYYKIFTNFNSGSTNEIAFHCKYEKDNPIVIAALNSNLFFWFYELFSSCRVVNFDNLKSFRLDLDKITNENRIKLKKLTDELMSSYKKNAEVKIRHYAGYGDKECFTIYARKSKNIMDRIDQVLGNIYGLNIQEVNYISNYMVEYRTDDNKNDD